MAVARRQNKTKLIVTIVILALTLGVVGGIALAMNMNKGVETETVTPPAEQASDTPAQSPEEQTPTVEEPAEPTIDPSTVKSIDIEPMNITVSYKKGIPGFEFAVKRTADRTQYVEFSSPDLKGTKCTDDEGLFASIIKNPSSVEDEATTTKTVKVGEDTYGLSLAGKNCTGDAALLKEYQDAFSYAFSLLKEME